MFERAEHFRKTSQNKDTLLSMMKWVSDRLRVIAVSYTSFSSVHHSTCIQDHSTRHGLVNLPASMVPRQCIDCTTSYTQCYAQLLFLLCYNKIINLSASIHMCTGITCSHHNHARIQIYTKHYVQACYYVGNLILSLLLEPKSEITNLQKAHKTRVSRVTLNSF